MKHRWIRDDIIIDFDIPGKAFKNLLKEAEELDLAGNTEFFCVAEQIDVLAKNSYGAGKLTQKQWELLCEKYPINRQR